MCVFVADVEMLIRCGGNVIEIGRNQVVAVVTATVLLLLVSIYSISLLHIGRADSDRIRPTPIDDILPRPARHRRRHDDQADSGLDSARNEHGIPPRKTSGSGLAV